MSAQQAGTDDETLGRTSGKARLLLSALFVGSFVLGTAELLMVGVLNLIATDLDVSIPTTGTLVTAYALGVAIGGPLLTALTIRLDKRVTLIGALALFAVINVVPVLLGQFAPFLVARVLTGSLHGLYVAVAFIAAVAVVPENRAGRAISVVFSGFALSAALGAPLGTLVGQGLGWRNSFVAITLLSLVACAAVAAVIPRLPEPTGGSAGDQARYAFAPRVLTVLLLGALLFASSYGALTYLVPFLERVTGVSGALVSVFLLCYGVAAAIGSFNGGRFADRGAARTMLVGGVGTVGALLALYLGGTSPVVVALALVAWGLFAQGAVPAYQYRVLELAGPGSQLASALPASAANVGIAVGSAVCGLAIDGDASSAVLTGLLIGVVAIPLAWAATLLRPPVTTPAAPARTGAAQADAGDRASTGPTTA
ncbi:MULTISPECIES: MFS transporter [Actinosynnema]|uniref:MFS transporter n=1 Tax=Actinosynnema TaxID=40566 RepID=UPI0020A30ABF|nr:MFS transporter [Actinosynnema pretiosum]MCP2094954.1 MFS transporter, DHA1 family, arabinose polymer transporter [Actinosynnema pretiosum]